LVRAESTALLPQRSKVNIEKLLQDVQIPYILLASDKDMTIRLSIDKTMQTVWLDERLIYDAIANLLDNAVKYGDSGTNIEIETSVKKGKLFISVSDIGQVIPKEDRVRVFDKFVRGEHNVDKIRQLGLGLTYVKEVTEAHGGKVYVDPRFANGAKIVMNFPLARLMEEEKHEKNTHH